MGSLAAALLAAAVLGFDPGGVSPFGPVKWLVIPTLVLGGVAAASAGRRPLRIARGPALAWVAFLAIVALAAGLGVDGVIAWIGTHERRFGALTWLIVALAFVLGQQAGTRARQVLAGAAAAVCGVVGLLVLAELAGHRPVDLVGGGSRPVATFGSSALLGAGMSLIVPLAIGRAIASTSRSTRIASAAGGALGAIALVASGARAAWVGVLVAVAFVSAVHWSRRIGAALVAAFAFAVVLAVATGVAGRVGATFDGDAAGGARGRVDEWRVAARMVARHPLTGVGPEGYRIAFGRAVDDSYEQVHGRDPIPDRAHDALLDVAATTGLPGLGLYVLVVVAAGRFVVRALRAVDDPVTTAAAVGVVAYGTQSLFLFPLAELDPLAWMIAGGCVAATARSHETIELRAPRIVNAAAVAATVAALVVGVTGVAADRRARDSAGDAVAMRPDVLRYRLLAAAAHEEVGSSAGLDRAIDDIARARRISRQDPAVRSEWTRLLLDRAQRTGTPRHVRLARTALEDLVRLDPRNAEVLLRLGVARSLANDDAGAEEAWLAAERLAPRSAAASVNLALAYARQGRRAEALAASRRALARDPGSVDAGALEAELDDDGT